MKLKDRSIVRVGFTGTRVGLTKEQKERLTWFIKDNYMDEFHHGCCIGADAEAHNIVRAIRPECKIVGHPPTHKDFMARLTVDERRKEYPYLLRNSNIVHGTRHLIVCPKHNEITLRSGTCQTFRQAKKANKPITIIWPTGDIDDEEKVQQKRMELTQ